MDHRLQKWVVIDGLQRMWTIVRFLRGGDWKLSELDDVDPQLSGKPVAALKDDTNPLHHYYTRVENLSIPITVLRCDFNKKPHLEYLFTIFHRLNTGGLKLNNQEIRNCIYGGSFNTLLKYLDEYPAWRRLNKMKPKESYRFSKQEIILRFFAFHEAFEKYNGHLAKFLNDYMQANRQAKEAFIDEKKKLFMRTIDCIYTKVFDSKPMPKTPITLLEGTLVGVGRNIDALEVLDKQELQSRFHALRNHPDYSERSLTEGLSKKPKVIERLTTAVGIFAGK